MKAFIEHDQSGSLFQGEGQWAPNSQEALAFPAKEHAEDFRKLSGDETPHAVSRLDPILLARLSARPPGIFQAGE